MAISARDNRTRWIYTAGLFFFLAINFADKAMMGLAAEPIMHELRLSHAEFGRIAASFFALFSVSAVIVGLLANRIKTRWLLLAMVVVWSISQAPLLIATIPATLVLSRVLLGASEGPAYPVAMHALYKWFPDEERVLPSSVLSIGGAFGSGCVAPIITMIIVHVGWRAAFLSLAGVGIVWALIWLVIGKEGPLGSSSAHGHDGGSPDRTALPERVPLRALLLSRTFIGATVMTFAMYVILTIAVIWLPSYLVKVAGYSMVQASWIVVLPSLAQMALGPLFGWGSQRLMRGGLSSRHARGTAGGLTVVTCGAALALMTLMPAGSGLIVAVTITFGIGAFVFASGITLAGEISPPAQRGGVLGIYNCIYTLAGLVTPMVIGHVIDAAVNPIEGYRLGIQLAGAFAVVCGLLSVLLIDPAGDREAFSARAVPASVG